MLSMTVDLAFRLPVSPPSRSTFIDNHVCARRLRNPPATAQQKRSTPQMLFARLFRREQRFMDLVELSKSHPAVEVRSLRKSYERRAKRGRARTLTTITAVDGISFSVRRGEIFGLLGPNSSGKTTTLRCLSTLCRPDGGSIHFYGADVLANPRLARQMLGFVAQSAGVDKVLTGREHLELFAGLAHLSRTERDDAIAEVIDVLNLGEFIDRQTSVYSGGVIRRLDLAICLLHRPPILILDEPTVGLDIESRTVIWRVLQQLRDGGASIILTSHYLEEVDLLSDRLAIMEKGVILAEGTPTHLKNALGGDRVSLRLSEFTEYGDAQRAAAEIKRRGLAREALVNRMRANAIELVVDPDRSTIGSEIVGALREVGFPKLFSFAQSKPSLDDVYLAATGRSIADADAAAKERRDAKTMRKESMA